MNSEFRIGLLLAVALTGGCPSSDDQTTESIPGELGYSRSDAVRIEYSGTRVFGNLGASVYSFDLEKPDDPRPEDSRAYAALSCPEACAGFEVDPLAPEEPIGYLLDRDEISLVGLPDADLPFLQLGLPDPNDYSAESLALLPGPALAVGRTRHDPGSQHDLLFFDVSSTADMFRARLFLDYHAAYLENEGSRLFTFPYIGLAGIGTNQVIVYDTTDLDAPFELARTPLPLPASTADPDRSLVIRRIGVRGTDLAVTSMSDGVHSACYIAWYSMSDDYQTATLLGATDRYEPMEGVVPRFRGDRLIVAAGMDCAGEATGAGFTVSLAVGTAGNLVEKARIPMREGYATDLELDPERELVYVGGLGLQVLDLDFLLQ